MVPRISHLHQQRNVLLAPQDTARIAGVARERTFPPRTAPTVGPAPNPGTEQQAPAVYYDRGRHDDSDWMSG